MITCQHAHQLFDRYLDGELSASLQTELHAHRLNCSACQNELAMLEACGDVITMDRCEPQVSVSFTDRVVLAQRGRRPAPTHRWGRTLWLIGSPMAAAASIAFTLLVITPPIHKTAVLGAKQATPKSVQIALGKTLAPDAQNALDQTPRMTDGSFLDAFLAPIVEHSKTTIEGTRRSAEDFQMLVRRSLSDTNAELYARWQAMQQNQSATGPDRTRTDLDPLDPANLIPPIGNHDSDGTADRGSHPEAL